MSGVDVLAVLDELVADMGEPLPGTTSHKLHQVRDAVAELVRAVDEIHPCFECGDPFGEWSDLDDALARCRGGAR